MTAPTCPLDGKPIHDQARVPRGPLVIRLPSGTFCVVDGKPTADNATLCSDCTSVLEQALAEMPALADELDLMLSRQTASGVRNGSSRSSERPLPYDTGASAALSDIRSKVVGWVRAFHEDEPDAPWPEDTISGMTVWLLARIEAIRHHEAAAEVYAEILDARTHGQRVTDRHAPDKVYAGLCGSELHGVECTTPIYARPDATNTACPTCGALHEVEERRDKMRAEVVELLLPAAEVAEAVTALWGESEVDEQGHVIWKRVSTDVVRGMAKDDLIEERGQVRRQGRLVTAYHVGEVLKIVLDRHTKRKARHQRAA